MLVARDLCVLWQTGRRFYSVPALGQALWTFDASKVNGAGDPTARLAAYMANDREFIVNAFKGNRNEGDVNITAGAVIACAPPASK
jgi:hypothetical protein